MVRILVNLTIAMVLFAAGLGVSWYMTQKDLEAAAAEEAAADRSFNSKVPADLQQAKMPHEPASNLPVPLRGKPMTAEEIFRYGASIRSQHDALVKRQEQIEREESRLKLMYEDIRGMRTELDGLNARVNDSLTMAERLLAQLQAEWTELESQMSAANDGAQGDVVPSTAYAPGEIESTKKMSKLLQGMPTAEAAKLLKTLSDEGKIVRAAKVLDNIEERDAAKILSEMGDPALWVQLTEALSNLQRPEKANKRR